MGAFIAVGIDQGLTGRPADLLVIDDPIKTLEQALSVKHNQFIWDKCTQFPDGQRARAFDVDTEKAIFACPPGNSWV